MSTTLTASAVHHGRMHFEGLAGDNPPVNLDYVPPLGDGHGIRPMELLLMSLASCSGASVVALLQDSGHPLEHLEVRASGERRDEHPTIFTSIMVEFIVTSKSVDLALLQRAVAAAEEQYCPVWAMLKYGTEIHSRIRLAEAELAP